MRQAAVGVLREAHRGARAAIAGLIAERPREAHRAIHDYAWLTDRIVTLTLDFAARWLHPLAIPTAAERIGALAVGGYGRAEMAPFSDVDLLVPDPLQADPLGREPDRERALHALGPAAEGRARGAQHRRMPAARAQRRHHPHHPARAPLPLGRAQPRPHPRRPALARALPGDRARVRRAEARRARRAARAAGQHPLPAGAERQGGQGGAARPADALLDRQVPQPRRPAGGPGAPGGLHPRRIPDLRRGGGVPLDRAGAPAPPDRARHRAADLRHPGRDRRDPRLPVDPGAARRRALHAGLLHPRQARGRSHPHLPRRARGAAREVAAEHRLAAAQRLQLPQGPDRRRLPPEARAARPGRPRGVPQGPGEPPAPLRGRAEHRHPDPPGRAAPGRGQPAPDRRPGARGPRGEPHLPGAPAQPQQSRAGAAADERGRGARRLHPRVRPDRGDDAVQHVPLLHGGRAHHPHHLDPEPDRAARAAGRGSDLERHPGQGREPPGALRGAAPARHRQGLGAQPLRGGRRDRRAALPALRPRRGGDRARRLAGAASPPDVGRGAEARPGRAAHRARLRPRGEEPDAAEALDGA